MPGADATLTAAESWSLTAAEFCVRAQALIGRDARFHRPLYRQRMRSGAIDVAQVAAWRDAPQDARAQAQAALAAPPLPALEASVAAEDAETGATRKLRLRFHDGARVETVLIPMRGGRRHTLCVSTQVGCRMGCAFCHTATMGLQRQLSAAEIVAQVVAARAATGIEARNVVFMGMGEPLDNPEAVARAVAVLTDRGGLAIAHRHLTVSTVGRLEPLARWAELGLGQVNLAVSLGAALPEVREALMPIARAAPLPALKAALKAVPLVAGRRLLISCIVIPGLTDTPPAVAALARWVAGLRALVNLIPYNPIPGRDWRAPACEEVAAMRESLARLGVPVRLRATRGRAAMAACGQLATARRLAPRRDG